MSIEESRPEVGTSATAISSPNPRGIPGTRVLVRNPDSAAVSVFLGSSTVTVSTGTELAAGESFADVLETGETLYAVASQAQVVQVLEGGV